MYGGSEKGFRASTGDETAVASANRGVRGSLRWESVDEDEFVLDAVAARASTDGPFSCTVFRELM